MKSATLIVALFAAGAAYAGPITLLSDSRFRHSDGFAQYNSTNSNLNGQQTIGWNMQASTPFGGMDGYDLNEVPVGYYNWGSGAYLGGMVGLTSVFADGVIRGSGYTSNYLGVATSGPRANEGDSGYARLKMRSHYEITFRVDEAIYYDLSGSILGDCLLSFASNDGFSLLGSNNFAYSGLLNSGVYTILADACTDLARNTDGETREQKRFDFNLTYQAVPDSGTTALLIALGLAGVVSLARRQSR